MSTPPRLLTINGQTMSAKQWSRLPSAAKYQTIISRLNRYWDEADAVFGETVVQRDPRTNQKRTAEIRARRLADGDCAWCGVEPRDGTRVLGRICGEKNNSRRRMDRFEKAA